ncbi:MAG: DUF2079 domain-containing protein, partial [Acidobacteria bacterium]|nr:DUF2079 domain-containing protein [Acidobacteriota bacterium]
MQEIYLIFKYILVPAAILAIVGFYRRGLGKFFSSGCWSGWCVPASVVLCVLLSTLSMARYLTLHASYYDLGVYERKIDTALHGRPLALIEGHWTPSLIAAALPYAIYSSSMSLLLVQSIALALAGFVLARLAKRILGRDDLARLVALCFFLHPAVQYGWLFDFHPDAFYPVLIFFLFLWSETGNRWRCLLPGLLAAGVKEPLTISTSLAGFRLAGRRGLRAPGLLLGSAALLIFVVYANWEGGGVAGASQAVAGYPGESPAATAANLILKPSLWMGRAFAVDKLFYLYLLGAPLALVFARSLDLLIPGIPLVAISILSPAPQHFNIHNHYGLGIVPFLFLASLYGLRRLSSRVPGRTAAAVPATLFLSLYFSAAIGALPYSGTFWQNRGPFTYRDYLFADNHAQVVEAMRLVPGEASLA